MEAEKCHDACKDTIPPHFRKCNCRIHLYNVYVHVYMYKEKKIYFTNRTIRKHATMKLIHSLIHVSK